MTRQTAYHALSDLMDRAEDIADNLDVDNEEALREAIADAEDLLMDLDDAEYELLKEMDKAEESI